MIPSQRALFDLPREVAYLNCAYIGPMLAEAVEAGRAALARKARPWTIRPADFHAETEALRPLFARVIGADAEGVALVPSASYAIATAALNLPLAPGRSIVLAAEQFPSNVHPWRRAAAAAGAEIVTARPGPDGDLTAALLAAIDARTAIVACAQCRWTDGALVDLVRVGAAARAVGAALVLDLTQSAGALPFDAAAVRPDFVAAAAYKWLLGPYATGFLWVAPHRREGRALEETWLGRAGSENFARLVDYRDDHRPGARRFDMGEAPNFALLPPLRVGLERILAWDVSAIQATLAARTAAIADRAAGLGLLASDPGLRAGHFLGLRFPEGPPPDLPDRLAGAQVHVSLRGDSLRVTPHLYNDDADVDRLIEALAQAL
ncbi:aminotransferase class V-fold PLP-dependent enzyme [Amaricoccus sp.]|uniref:aminotransferase class V-fold PLP-dependent enzyme n=1 Tax=Amaricoccus sp. TaxID=1872485 RepID=UPI001B68D233|nr:aminotransferase class V-fold PLP-dependent enzyme [Amaricoccus sp.]MBP7000198.1 aminotransferase class V-fold PLP-dependent enzyme [Amaricoccus sp.]